MNLTAFKEIAETNHWLAIWPEITLGVVAVLLLIMELVLPPSRRRLIPLTAIAVQGVVLVLLLLGCAGSFTGQTVFAGMITLSPMAEIMRLFFLIASMLVGYLALIYFDRQKLPRVEFFHILLVVTAAMMLLVMSSHFLMLFVALETVTVGFYVLVAYARNSSFSLEAGLKYLIMGALSTAILLFGIVLLYGAAGNPALPAHTADGMQFSALATFIAANPENLLVKLGVVMVIAGIAFKIGAVPFQIWVPDVYQGAPSPTTAFLAVASKAAGFMVLINLVVGPFAAPELRDSVVVPLLATICVLTILFGNTAALGQRNVKRLMGLSGIAHAGYLLVGVVAIAMGIYWAIQAVIFYLFTYLLASFLVFGVMAHVASSKDEEQELDHYQDLGKKQPFLGGLLAIGLGSLAGIPPLAGFIAKVLIFIAAFQAQLYVLLGVSIVGVVISIYYYFGWMREALFRVWQGSRELQEQSVPGNAVHAPSPWSRILLGALAVVTVLLGLYQGSVLGAWGL